MIICFVASCFCVGVSCFLVSFFPSFLVSLFPCFLVSLFPCFLVSLFLRFFASWLTELFVSICRGHFLKLRPTIASRQRVRKFQLPTEASTLFTIRGFTPASQRISIRESICSEVAESLLNARKKAARLCHGVHALPERGEHPQGGPLHIHRVEECADQTPQNPQHRKDQVPQARYFSAPNLLRDPFVTRWCQNSERAAFGALFNANVEPV